MPPYYFSIVLLLCPVTWLVRRGATTLVDSERVWRSIFVRPFMALVLAIGCCLPAAAQVPTLSVPGSAPDAGQVEQLPASPSVTATDAVRSYHLSLEEAKSRALSNSVIMDLASAQVAAKCHALDAARKDYLPKLLNSFSYFHFDSDLGTVVTTPGIFNPATSIAVPVVEQDSTIYTAAAIQPITPLLKVRAAVEISEADVGDGPGAEAVCPPRIDQGHGAALFRPLGRAEDSSRPGASRCWGTADGGRHERHSRQDFARRGAAES